MKKCPIVMLAMAILAGFSDTVLGAARRLVNLGSRAADLGSQPDVGPRWLDTSGMQQRRWFAFAFTGAIVAVSRLAVADPAPVSFHSLDRVVGQSRFGLDGGASMRHLIDADGSEPLTISLRSDAFVEWLLTPVWGVGVSLPLYAMQTGDSYFGAGPIAVEGYRLIAGAKTDVFLRAGLHTAHVYSPDLDGYDTNAMLQFSTVFPRLTQPAVNDRWSAGIAASVRWRHNRWLIQADLGAEFDPTHEYREKTEQGGEINPLWIHLGVGASLDLGRIAAQIEVAALSDPFGGPSVLGNEDGQELYERVASMMTLGLQYRAEGWSASTGLSTAIGYTVDPHPIMLVLQWQRVIAD